MLAVLEQTASSLNNEKQAKRSAAIVFGEEYFSLNISEIPFLKGRPVTALSFPQKNASSILSVHEVS